jgi:iron uptake system EfeUOB component EfeO/EfeM
MPGPFIEQEAAAGPEDPPDHGRTARQEPGAGSEPSPPGPARSRGRRRDRLVTLVSVATALCLGAGLAAVLGTGRPAHGGSVDVGAASCGTSARHLAAGPLSFTVTDTSHNYAAIYLTDPRGSDVYAEVPWLAPGRSAPLSTSLDAGQYAFRCVMSDASVRTSADMTVTGRARGGVKGFAPLPDLAMTAPVAAYRGYLEKSLPGLLADCRALDADVARGDLGAARKDWLTAHLAYERLGAAYNSFGDFDGEIDGTSQGLPQGAATPGWTGFFSIEHALWHGATAARVRPLTRGLVTDVVKLGQDFPSEEIDPGDLPLRAHEILENSLQFQLTDADDYGSGTTLATLGANVEGTTEVVRVLRPLVAQRDPGLLAGIDRGTARVRADVAAARRPDGTWTPVGALPAQQRQQVDGDLGALLEDLSALPNLLYPRTSA